MKYDDASWHYEGDFPKDLPPEAGGVHIAMFAIWAWENGLAGELITDESPGCLDSVRERTASPSAIFFRWSDGKLFDEDFNDEGNQFAANYYLDGVSTKLGQYIVDYEATLALGLPTPYHVPDTWQTFDKISPIIASRFEEFRRNRV